MTEAELNKMTEAFAALSAWAHRAKDKIEKLEARVEELEHRLGIETEQADDKLPPIGG